MVGTFSPNRIQKNEIETIGVLATSELRKRPGKSEVDNGSWDCFRGRKQKARPQKQSRDALSTSLLPDLLRNFEVANNDELHVMHCM